MRFDSLKITKIKRKIVKSIYIYIFRVSKLAVDVNKHLHFEKTLQKIKPCVTKEAKLAEKTFVDFSFLLCYNLDIKSPSYALFA